MHTHHASQNAGLVIRELSSPDRRSPQCLYQQLLILQGFSLARRARRLQIGLVLQCEEVISEIIFGPYCRISMLECKGMGRVHSGFYGALFNGDEEQGRLFDDLVGSIHSADAGKGKAIYLTGVSTSTMP